MKNITKNFVGVFVAFSLLATGQASGQAAKWQDLLGNQKLVQVVSSGPASMNIPGVDISAGGVKTTNELHLCKDGSFLRVETTNVVSSKVNAPGVNVASGPVNDVRKASGKWKIVSADSVHVNIQLTPTKSTDLAVSDRKLDISFDGAYTIVNDERWNRMKSPICR